MIIPTAGINVSEPDLIELAPGVMTINQINVPLKYAVRG